MIGCNPDWSNQKCTVYFAYCSPI